MTHADKLYVLGAIWSAAGFVIYAVPGTRFVHWAIAAGGGLFATTVGSFLL